MPTAPVDKEGTVLYYEDSGAPEGSSTYLTVVLVHGLLFHGRIWQRLFPHADRNDLRLVCVNHRDYPGSTPFTAAELEIFQGGDTAQQAEQVKALGAQIAAFMERFARIHNIPKMGSVAGKRVGGMALVTWSMGGGTAMSLLGNAESLPKDTTTLLSQYLRTVVLLDVASGTSCGQMPPQEAYHPFRDPTLSLEEKIERGESWISAYFTKVHDLDAVTPEALAARTAQHDTHSHPPGTLHKLPTALRMTRDELNALVDRAALVRSSLPFLRVHSSVFRANFERALFNTGCVLPSVKVLVVWCDETFVDPMWAAKIISDALKGPASDGGYHREVEMHCLRGCNHFPHWDEPERIIELLVTKI